MKTQADKHRSARSFQIGDNVYLRLQPFVQSSLAPRSHHKLCFKYYGPFKILEKIGSVAYKLELPSTCTIHPVFHVSLLKPAPPSGTKCPSTLPELSEALQVSEQVQCGTRSIPQLLIKWSDLPADLATWEDAIAIKQKFPVAPAWGHAGSQGGGCQQPTPRGSRSYAPAQAR
jgi:hypothetical protein